jgi:uncharacterized protein YlzI (FlbEa/FlbD family)
MKLQFTVTQVWFTDPRNPLSTFKSSDKPSYINPDHICALGWANGFVTIHLVGGHVFVVKENMKEIREKMDMAYSA